MTSPKMKHVIIMYHLPKGRIDEILIFSHIFKYYAVKLTQQLLCQRSLSIGINPYELHPCSLHHCTRRQLFSDILRLTENLANFLSVNFKPYLRQHYNQSVITNYFALVDDSILSFFISLYFTEAVLRYFSNFLLAGKALFSKV